MADVRALLRAKRQEAQVSHPFASYNTSGQLKCTICGTVVKQASGWEGHLGSKAHRNNVVRVREEELKEQQRLQKEQELEKLREMEITVATGKRKADDEEPEVEGETKKQKVDSMQQSSDAGGGGSSFPTDFFSDASRAPITSYPDDSDNEEEPAMAQVQTSQQTPSVIDHEYERFQRELLNGPDYRETYDRATVFAEPEMAPEAPEGFPANEPAVETGVQQNVLDEDEVRKRKEQEDRELIMDRLLDEERAQEEADTKVRLMKSRIETLKKKREVAKSKS